MIKNKRVVVYVFCLTTQILQGTVDALFLQLVLNAGKQVNRCRHCQKDHLMLVSGQGLIKQPD